MGTSWSCWRNRSARGTRSHKRASSSSKSRSPDKRCGRKWIHSVIDYRARKLVPFPSRIKSLGRPLGSGTSEHEPVMETVQPTLPKLYSPRNESVSSPERRKRDFLFLETIFDLGKPILKDKGFREHVTLARRPGSYLTSPTPRVEICLRLP